MRAALALPLFLSAALVATPALAARDIDKVNGSIHAEAGAQYGTLETVNGSIHIERASTTGAASTVNGGIELAPGARTGELSTVNGAIKVGTDARVDGDIHTVNGGIFVDRGSEVRGGIETVNGAIGLVGTALTGGIGTVNGDITVGAGSRVQGGLHVEKAPKRWLGVGPQRVPRIVIGPGAQVLGPMVFERPVELYVHSTARTGAVTGATVQRYAGDRPPAR